MPIALDKLRSMKSWPKDIGFVPFVGEHYDKGIGGAKVLLLGESHYISEKDKCKDAGSSYTRCIFGECETETDTDKRKEWGRFFRRLDEIVCLSESPTGKGAADAWRHIAFANFIQNSVGSSASSRKGKDWESGKCAFPILLGMLQPDVILVLGKMTFDRTPDLNGEKLGELQIKALEPHRSLWKMPHESGSALMSWVYHPSWNKDSQKNRIAVFEKLLRLASPR